MEKLWELQTTLSHLSQKEKELNTKPEDFAAIDDEYTAATAEITALDGRIEQVAAERRRIERELQEAQELLKKYQGQLMQVKNQQQYSAAWKEIDTARKQVKDYEDALLKQMTDTEEVQKQLDERRGGYDDLKSRHTEAYEKWQHSLGDLRQEIAVIKQKASEIESGIPDNLRREFHRIFKQRQGMAVAKVESGTCGGCRVRLRPQAQQQVRRGEVTICEGCRRILYHDQVGS